MNIIIQNKIGNFYPKHKNYILIGNLKFGINNKIILNRIALLEDKINEILKIKNLININYKRKDQKISFVVNVDRRKINLALEDSPFNEAKENILKIFSENIENRDWTSYTKSSITESFKFQVRQNLIKFLIDYLERTKDVEKIEIKNSKYNLEEKGFY